MKPVDFVKDHRKGLVFPCKFITQRVGGYYWRCDHIVFWLSFSSMPDNYVPNDGNFDESCSEADYQDCPLSEKGKENKA